MKHIGLSKFNVAREYSGFTNLEFGYQKIAERIYDVIEDEFACIVYPLRGGEKFATAVRDRLPSDVDSILIPSNAARGIKKNKEITTPLPDELRSKVFQGIRETYGDNPLFIFADDSSSSGSTLALTKKYVEDCWKDNLLGDLKLDECRYITAAMLDESGYIDLSIINSDEANGSKKTLDDVPINLKDTSKGRHYFYKRNAYAEPLEMTGYLAADVFNNIPKERGLAVISHCIDRFEADALCENLKEFGKDNVSLFILDENDKDIPDDYDIIHFLFSAREDDDFQKIFVNQNLSSYINRNDPRIYTACLLDRNPFGSEIDFTFEKMGSH